MPNNSLSKPIMVIAIFVMQVLLNWIYVLWARSQYEIMLSGWFVVTPLLGYFYFFFAFVATAGLYYRKSIALGLSYAIILCGIIAAVISYNLVFKLGGMIALVIVPLIILNCFVVSYIAYNQNYFKED